MSKILIAGGTGHIGSYLTKQLRKDDIISFGTSDCNLLSEESIKNYFSQSLKFDVLIFLVGLAHDKGKKRNLDEFNQLNYITLKNLLTFFKRKNNIPKKIIFGSTISIYGENYYINEYYENSSKNPKSPYAITKLKAENYLINNFPNNTWILRFSPCYSDYFLLNINRRIKINNFYFQISKGEKKLSLCSIQNIRIVIESIITKSIPYGVYNVSDKFSYKYADLFKWAKPRRVIYIPRFIIKFIYLIGIVIKNIFLKENSIKLLTDNVYPSIKINKYVNIHNNLYSISNNDK